MLAKFLWLVPVLLLLGAAAGPASLAGVTSVLLDSDPGEPLGGGEFSFYGASDGDLAVSQYPPTTPGAVYLSFHGEVSWQFEFAAPEGEVLVIGAYENAVPSYQRGPGQPGLAVWGNQRGCGNTFGRFEVKQVGFDAGGTLTAFWATFEQTCAGAVLRGEVRLNADVPVVIDAPSRRNAFEGHELSFTVEGHDTLGNPVSLSAADLPQGATFTDAGDGTGRFAWTPEIGQAGRSWTAFHGQGAGGDADTVYIRIDAVPDFDDFDHPIAFSTLPFRSTIDSPIAGPAADDPVCTGMGFGGGPGTVWYAFTPVEDARIRAFAYSRSSNGGPGIGVSINTGVRGALEPLSCGFEAARADVVAGRTYSIMVGLPVPAPPFIFLVDPLPPPPPNDVFDDATVIAALPFADTVDMDGAATGLDDPIPCGYGPPLPNVWYAYTPAEDTRVTIDTAGSSAAPWMTVFSGTRGALVPEACGGPQLISTARAGRTYYLMISDGVIYSSFPSQLQLTITGAPTLGIQVSIAPDGVFVPRSGAAAIHGTAQCSRPAHIVVSGTLQQGRGKALGRFESTIACSGVTAWTAEVAADMIRGRRGHFTGGPAGAVFDAVGVADDDAGNTASHHGGAAVRLRAAPPNRPPVVAGAGPAL
jgi:hypothetical protein